MSSIFSFSQDSKKRYKGTYKPGAQVVGNTGKKYKYLDKKHKRTRLQVKKRNKAAEKRRKAKMKYRKKNKKRLKRGKKSLYSSPKKRKKKYPKNKKALLPKVTAIFSASPILTDRQNVVNEEGNLVNLFSQSNVGPALNIGAVYNIASNVSLGGELTGGIFGKENYSFSLSGLRLMGYYKFGDPVRSKIMPYIRLSVEHSFFNIEQKSYEENYVPDNSSDDPTEANVTNVKIRQPEIVINAVPYLGFGVGAGVVYKVNRKVEVFFKPSVTFYDTYDSNRIETFFPSVQPSFKVFRANFGVNINLFSSKSLF